MSTRARLVEEGRVVFLKGTQTMSLVGPLHPFLRQQVKSVVRAGSAVVVAAVVVPAWPFGVLVVVHPPTRPLTLRRLTHRQVLVRPVIHRVLRELDHLLARWPCGLGPAPPQHWQLKVRWWHLLFRREGWEGQRHRPLYPLHPPQHLLFFLVCCPLLGIERVGAAVEHGGVEGAHDAHLLTIFWVQQVVEGVEDLTLLTVSIR